MILWFIMNIFIYVYMCRQLTCKPPTKYQYSSFRIYTHYKYANYTYKLLIFVARGKPSHIYSEIVSRVLPLTHWGRSRQGFKIFKFLLKIEFVAPSSISSRILPLRG